MLDTNVFVGGSFARHSSSAELLDRVKRGELRMVWNADTRRETRRILTKIPPLSWERVADLFRVADEQPADLDEVPYEFVRDPEDRKFLALAEAHRVPLITNDDDLLSVASTAATPVLTPSAYLDRFG